jgi:hypothetical protein
MKGEVRCNSIVGHRSWNTTRRLVRKASAGFFMFTLIIMTALFPVRPGWSKTIHVPADSSTIQAGINGAETGDTVLVADGIYTGEGNKNIDFLGKAIVVRSENGPDSTIIDCEGKNEVRGLCFFNEEGPGTKVEGLTIQNGNHLKGGGIYIKGSSPTITNCNIQHNEGELFGGGIYVEKSSPAIVNCNILYNITVWFGGGIYIEAQSFPTITYCVISNNEAWWEGGAGIYSHYHSFPNINNCFISDNQAGERREPGEMGYGGGIYCDSATIINCQILGNKAAYSGAGICCRSTQIMNCFIADNSAFWMFSAGGGITSRSSTITNCIITRNEAADGPGGGIYGWGSTTIANSIIVNNKPGYTPGQGWEGAGIYGTSSTIVTNSIVRENRGFEISGQPIVSYSNIEGGWLGAGNIDEDPLFRDPENEDYHLMATYCGDPYDSPCIDAGRLNILDEVLDCFHGLGTEQSDMGAYGGSNSSWPTAVEEDEGETPHIPKEFVLHQNYPNPFNSETVVSYSLPQSGRVTLSIYNVLGQRVATLFEGIQEIGLHNVVWNAGDFSSGIYFARLEVGGHSKTIKMVLLR